jgi:hypothetical protein
LTDYQKNKFKLEIIKYIDDAYNSTASTKVEEEITEEPIQQTECEDERDMIPDKQIDWEFMEMIGVEHPDE